MQQCKEAIVERLNVEDDMGTANQTRERTEIQPGREVTMSQTLRAHILLVEDDASLARLEAGILTAQGYIVTLVENGELALNILQEVVPDLVLLDLDLPGTVNGWDVLKALRAYADTNSTPVLLTSAEATAQKRLRTSGEARSTLDHLPKPYPIQTLLKRIDRMLFQYPEADRKNS